MTIVKQLFLNCFPSTDHQRKYSFLCYSCAICTHRTSELCFTNVFDFLRSWDMSKFLNIQCRISRIKYPSFAKKWINIRKSYGNFYKVCTDCCFSFRKFVLEVWHVLLCLLSLLVQHKIIVLKLVAWGLIFKCTSCQDLTLLMEDHVIYCILILILFLRISRCSMKDYLKMSYRCSQIKFVLKQFG